MVIFGMTWLITIDVLGRYLFSRPTYVADELSGYSLIAITFWGLAHTQRDEKHIEITAITGHLPPRIKKWLKLTTLIISLAYFAWLTWATLLSTIQSYDMKSISITPLHTPLWIPYAFVPLGSAILTLQLIVQIKKHLRLIQID
jgi:TRAP-type C4-dicarboxylate transport system permease small subunit